MDRLNLHKIDFLVALIDEFGKRFGLSNRESYRYINQPQVNYIIKKETFTSFL